MNQEPARLYDKALAKLRKDLKTKWGYAPRIANSLKVPVSDVYNVIHGRKKSPVILKALVNEALQVQADESFDIVSNYLSNAAA